MCPACMATVALMVVKATSAGGVTALVIKKLHVRTGAKDARLPINTNGGRHGSTKNRIEG